jgi:hypothetical protein
MNSSNQSACLFMRLLMFARQQLGKDVTAVTNTLAIVGVLNASFSMLSVPYKRNVDVQFFPELLVNVWFFSFNRLNV